MKQLLLGCTGGSAVQILTNLSEDQIREIVEERYKKPESLHQIGLEEKPEWYIFVDPQSKESIHVYLPSVITWMLRDPPQQRKVAGVIAVPPSNLRK